MGALVEHQRMISSRVTRITPLRRQHVAILLMRLAGLTNAYGICPWKVKVNIVTLSLFGGTLSPKMILVFEDPARFLLQTPRGDKAMVKNVGTIDKVFRIIIGLGLLSLVFIGPQTLWGLLGIVPLATVLLGWCPVYSLFGLSSCSVAENPK